MMGCTQERLDLERNLSLVMGKPVRLRSPEALSLTPENFRRAYYRRAHEFHPDKAAVLGLDPEYLAGRFRSLQDAYSLILDSWNSGTFSALAREEAGEAGPSEPASRWAGQHTGAPRETSGQGGCRVPPRQDPAGERKPRIFHAGAIPFVRLRFAQYLYYAGRIDWDTLIRSLSWQYWQRPRLGDLGTELGLLDPAAVLDILRKKRIDELFGEAAVRLGYLGSGDISVLIGRQRLLNLPIGRFFTERGYLGKAELERALVDHARHNFCVRSGYREGLKQPI